jgi:hypothetical protein
MKTVDAMGDPAPMPGEVNVPIVTRIAIGHSAAA